MNALDNLAAVFTQPNHEVSVEPQLIPLALRSLNRMMEFAQERGVKTTGRA